MMTFVDYIIKERGRNFLSISLMDMEKSGYKGTLEEWFSDMYTEYKLLAERNWEEVLEKWGGWNSAPGYLTVKEFAEYLDYNFEPPKMKESNKSPWDSIQFPVIRNIKPTTLANEIEGIPTEDMPKRMEEMFASLYKSSVKRIEKELDEIRGVEGKEDRVEYLEGLLKSWKNGE